MIVTEVIMAALRKDMECALSNSFRLVGVLGHIGGRLHLEGHHYFLRVYRHDEIYVVLRES